jgi:hypothetical protein
MRRFFPPFDENNLSLYFKNCKRKKHKNDFLLHQINRQQIIRAFNQHDARQPVKNRHNRHSVLDAGKSAKHHLSAKNRYGPGN